MIRETYTGRSFGKINGLSLNMQQIIESSLFLLLALSSFTLSCSPTHTYAVSQQNIMTNDPLTVYKLDN